MMETINAMFDMFNNNMSNIGIHHTDLNVDWDKQDSISISTILESATKLLQQSTNIETLNLVLPHCIKAKNFSDAFVYFRKYSTPERDAILPLLTVSFKTYVEALKLMPANFNEVQLFQYVTRTSEYVAQGLDYDIPIVLAILKYFNTFGEVIEVNDFNIIYDKYNELLTQFIFDYKLGAYTFLLLWKYDQTLSNYELGELKYWLKFRMGKVASINTTRLKVRFLECILVNQIDVFENIEKFLDLPYKIQNLLTQCMAFNNDMYLLELGLSSKDLTRVLTEQLNTYVNTNAPRYNLITDLSYGTL